MLKSKIGRTLFGMVLATALASAAFYGCDKGDTGSDDTGLGVQFVSDGGAGATLSIDVKGELNVGEQVPFTVVALDPFGQPLSYIRIFCETEKGIAIIEPSSGGVAFEHTGPDGSMSGVLGGLLPGSFMIECRAPEGFNLVDRERIHIGGSVSPDFVGFPGAAGGNLGGGVLVDMTPDDPDNEGVSITSIGYTTVTGTTASPSGPIDITRNLNCDGVFQTNDPEPWGADSFSVTVANGGEETVRVTSVAILISDGRPASTSFAVNSVIAAGGTGTITGVLTELVVASPTIKTLAASQYTLLAGTYPVTVTIAGVTEEGDDFSVAATTSVTFMDQDNCEDGAGT